MDTAIIEHKGRFMNVQAPFTPQNRNSHKAANVIIIYSETSNVKL